MADKFDFKPQIPNAANGKPSNPLQGCLIGCGVLVLIPIVFVIIAVASSDGSSSSNSGQYEAIAQCEARIENLLKAPATADFETSATGSGSTWTVNGSVDAENSFGALIRSTFQCTVVLQGDSATTTVNSFE
jgi:hypothetical protein